MKRTNQFQMHELNAPQHHQFQNWLTIFYEQTDCLPENFLRNREDLSPQKNSESDLVAVINLYQCGCLEEYAVVS